MIENLFTLFLYAFLEVLDFIVDFFPETDPTINAKIVTFVTPFKNIIATANYLFPVEDLFIVLGIVFGVESVIFLGKVMQWILTALVNRKVNKIVDD